MSEGEAVNNRRQGKKIQSFTGCVFSVLPFLSVPFLSCLAVLESHRTPHVPSSAVALSLSQGSSLRQGRGASLLGDHRESQGRQRTLGRKWGLF